MSWIRTLEPGEDSDWNEVRKSILSSDFLEGADELPAILEIMSLNPKACLANNDLHLAVTAGGSSLGERLEQMISLVVSVENSCEY